MTLFRARLVFLALLALALPVSAAWADTIITLQPTTEVNSPSIRLSDVFSGLPDKIDRSIAIAPAPGKSVTYNAHVLSKLAEQYRLNWKPQSLADRAVITRAATRITQDMIQEAVIEKLKEQNVTGKMEILFDNRSLDVALPADRAPKFELDNFNYDPANRRFRAALRAETDAAPVAVAVTGRVLIKRTVPVLGRRLEAGTIVGDADIDWITVPEDRLTADVLTEKSGIVGLEVRHDTAEGQLLHSRDVIPPKLVARGTLVVMKIQTPYMLITAQGRAMQDGAAGDVVRVTNTQSNRVIEGMVDGSGVVRVQTAQKLALAK
ncbi:MAG: flagellar basal body P-ring formation chaperone FlgA [Alphaproteobacteria bacterium]|nr:flagellar basal body P-ring formation chaperone FlgA [Alphaproteobacteria bacterium]